MFENVNLMDKEVYAYGATYGRGGEILYGELGLKAPELIQKEAIDGAGWTSLSLEVFQITQEIIHL